MERGVAVKLFGQLATKGGQRSVLSLNTSDDVPVHSLQFRCDFGSPPAVPSIFIGKKKIIEVTRRLLFIGMRVLNFRFLCVP